MYSKWFALCFFVMMFFQLSLSAQLFSCNFDRDLCGFVQSKSDTMDWIRNKGGTPSHSTGPSGDHTTGSGYYMYTETSQQASGSYCTLYKQVTVPSNYTWLVFFYHQYGLSGMGGLTVKINDDVVFQKSGSQGKAWKKVMIKLETKGLTTIYFTGRYGDTPHGDVAIDDVSVEEYNKANETSLSATKCQNLEFAMLECTSNAYPPAHQYIFYVNDELIKSSSSAEIRVRTTAVGNNNLYKCEPLNFIGLGENGTATIVTQEPPTITGITPTQTIVEGAEVVLVCNVTGSGPINIVWKKVGGSSFPSGHNLTIQNVTTADSGDYECTASNGNACPAASQGTSIRVLYKPRGTKVVHNPACLNSYVNLKCTTDADPPAHEYSFYLNDQLIQATSSAKLQINSTAVGNKTYRCQPNNTVGLGENGTATILTKAPPKITGLSPNKTVVEGSLEVVLICNVTGSRPINVIWKKVGGSSFPSGHYLTIQNLTTADHGAYECTANNGDACPTASERTFIRVLYKPKETKIMVVNRIVCLNSSVNMECKTNADPPAYEYSFYENDQLIQATNSSRLQINSTNAGNKTYRCEPRNIIGLGENGTAIVVTKAPPQITWRSPNKTVVEGSKLLLRCNATGSKPMKVQWRKLKDSGFPSGHGLTLVYECTASNGDECPTASARTFIRVLYKPRKTRVTRVNSTVCQNDYIHLECTTNADPPTHEYSFYVNDQLIRTINSTRLDMNSTIVGNNTYRCEPRNTIGLGENATTRIVTKAPPQITGLSPNQSVPVGSKVVLVCNVTGSDPMNVVWKKVGGSSFPSGQYLTIQSLAMANHGTYECTASNGNECPITSKRTSIHVLYKPKETNVTVVNSTVCLDDCIHLMCTTNADPPAHEYSFYVNDQLIRTINSTRLDMNSTIVGNNTYRCEPRNNIGLGENGTARILTKAPPKIEWVTPNQSVVVGSKVILKCNVTGCDPMKIVWRKVGGWIGGSNSTFLHGNNFTIQNLTTADHGAYECSASNGNECPVASSLTNINVLYQPNITAAPQQAVTLYENDQVNLMCKVDSNPRPDIMWTRENNVIGRGENLVLTAVQSVPGIYVCTASNGIGSNKTAYSNVTVKACTDNECQYNTTCISKGTTYRCDCPRGLIGRLCGIKDLIGSTFYTTIVFLTPVWTDEYKDSSSVAFKLLETVICKEMDKLFFEDLLKCKMTKARKGSIITETELVFNRSRTQSEVVGVLSKATVNNTFGSLRLDPSVSFQVAKVNFTESTPCDKKPCKFDGTCHVEGKGYKCDCELFRFGTHCEKGISLAVGILIIVIVSFIILINIILIIRCCRFANKKRYASESFVNRSRKSKQMTFSDNLGFDDPYQNYRKKEDSKL